MQIREVEDDDEEGELEIVQQEVDKSSGLKFLKVEEDEAI